MFKKIGIIFGIVVALYYYFKRYIRKFKNKILEVKDEDI